MTMESKRPSNFIDALIQEERAQGDQRSIHTRFPPEPNGYLHIGHAKSICLNFGLAKDYNGLCNLRFDDTNPTKEETEYVEAIMEDIQWLGYDWEDRLYYASDYFQDFYDYAEILIQKGKAYVCNHTAEEIRQMRGTLKAPGQECSHRDRPMEESLDLFRRMKAGEFEDGAMVLRARIDMSSPNLNMRDPVLYRILHAHHHRTGDTWCVYPMYDYAHPLSDYLEGITHSICTLEFEDHRPLYNWVLESLDFPQIERPRQIEFARLNLTNTLMSKRYLRALVEKGDVSGWDDPRMSTLSGVRRLGYPPEAIRDFCDRIGVAKANSLVDKALLEYCAREALSATAERVMAILRPLKVVLTNYPEGQTEWMEAELHPDLPEKGRRKIPFTRELFIDQDDFMEEPVKKFFRLAPGKEVRLKHGYIIQCNEVIKDPRTGTILELHCTYDPISKSGMDQSGKKVKGTIHWVSGEHAVQSSIRLYEDLILNDTEPNMDDVLEDTAQEKARPKINPHSLVELKDCLLEPYLKEAQVGQRFQFIRTGYFIKDRDSTETLPVFNRIVSLKDSWAKIEKGSVSP